MWVKVKKIIENVSDIKIAILSILLPISLMILWQLNNVGLPLGDAGDFLGASGSISNHFHNGEIAEGFYQLFAGKPWRPVSFHLIVFPFMLISKNNILFSAACVHILCLSLITVYSYYIFRIISESKISCFLSAITIGLLSGSFFPGGSFLFAEVGLTPAVLATIYHLYASKFMTQKKHSIYALVAMLFAFTFRPIEAITHLAPVLIFFFYAGYKKNIFSSNIILSVLKIFFVTLLILSLRGLDFGADHRILDLDENKASDLYMSLFYSLLLFLIIIFSPVFLSKIKIFYNYVKESNKNTNTYVIKIFTLFSFILFIWFIDSWRDLYSWVYRTQFGDIAAATNVNSNFLDMPNSFNDIFTRFYTQIQHAGLLPFIVISVFSLITLISNFFLKIKFDKDILMYLVSAIILPIIPVLITISNTPRKFAIAYILILIIGIIYILCFKNIKKYFLTALVFLIAFQTVSIYSVSLSKNYEYSNFISGALKKPRHDDTEKQIIELIFRNSKNFNFKNVDLAFLYPGIESDIFTTALINSLITDKSYITSLPVIFHDYSREWLTNRINSVHSLFLINPYGSMDISDEYAEKFSKNFNDSKFEQDKLYSDLMFLYFSEKINTEFGYKNIECIDLKARTKKYEGCLLINTNHVKSNNEN